MGGRGLIDDEKKVQSEKDLNSSNSLAQTFLRLLLLRSEMHFYRA